jgi:hypothetical protein
LVPASLRWNITKAMANVATTYPSRMNVALQAPKEFDGANGDSIEMPRLDGSNLMKSFCQLWGKKSPMIGTMSSTDT